MKKFSVIIVLLFIAVATYAQHSLTGSTCTQRMDGATTSVNLEKAFSISFFDNAINLKEFSNVSGVKEHWFPVTGIKVVDYNVFSYTVGDGESFHVYLQGQKVTKVIHYKDRIIVTYM